LVPEQTRAAGGFTVSQPGTLRSVALTTFGSPATAGIMFYDDEPRLSEQAFARDFAGDLPEAKARVLDVMQEPFQKGSADGKNMHAG
jgi:hypothetical protein